MNIASAYASAPGTAFLDRFGRGVVVEAVATEQARTERRGVQHEIGRGGGRFAPRAGRVAVDRERLHRTVGRVHLEHDVPVELGVRARAEQRLRIERREPQPVADKRHAHAPRVGHPVPQRLVDREPRAFDDIDEVDAEEELPQRAPCSVVGRLDVFDPERRVRDAAVPCATDLIRREAVGDTGRVLVHDDEEGLVGLVEAPEDLRPPDVGPGHHAWTRDSHLVVQRREYFLGLLPRDEPDASGVTGRARRTSRACVPAHIRRVRSHTRNRTARR